MTSENTTVKRPVETGYMTLIAGLLEILEEANGIEITRDMMNMNGKRRGERVGKKLGANKTPEKALLEFIEYVRPYYDIEMIESKKTKNGFKAELKFNKCMIKDLCKNRGISIKNPLCRSTHGFIKGALSFMTANQVDVSTPIAGWDTCIGCVEFKERRDRYHFF
jgi:predicted hydrocarbon binding protein